MVLIIIFTAFFLNKDIRGAFNNWIINVNSIFNIKDSSSTNLYEMELEMDDENRVLSGQELVTYYNRSDKPLKDIYFHIYPNAFNNKETSPVMFGDISYAYPKGFSPCNINILNVSVGGKKISYTICGTDSTILCLKLNRPVKKGKKLHIQIDFRLKIPESRDRIGYYDGSYIFGNWYPIAAVYDNRGWNLDPFYNIGDPFYSDVANYKIKLTLPDKYIVAVTGNIIDENVKNGERTLRIEGKSFRDFAWAASSKFKVFSREVDGINIKYYFLNSNEERISKALTAVGEAIRVFNESFGKYPYTSYSIVESHFKAGMEYPGLILIPDSYFTRNKSMLGLEGVIAHETAHQWWYGVVGNNEIDEAWLDEGLATYSKVMYFEKVNGASFGRDYYEKNISLIYENKRKSIKKREIILKPLYEFDGWKEYDTLAYKKGAVIFEMLREKTGDDMFLAVLKKYYNDNRFKNANTKDFKNVVETITNKKWDAFFNEWLSGVK